MIETTVKNTFSKSFADGCRPVAELTVSQWCDLYARLPPSAAEPGIFRVDRTPYMREIYDACTPGNGIRQVTLMMGAQLSKTELLNQLQAYLMHYNPHSFIFYQPTDGLVESYVKTKINPMIETNPVLNAIFKGKSTSNLSEKNFKGCVGSYKGGNSGNNYRMISAPFILADEIDSLVRDVDNEGKATTLMKNRAISYGQKAKIVFTSTPTEKDFSNIEEEFEQGDQRYFNVPCPHCQELQTFKFYTNLKYTKDPLNEKIVIPSSVYYECEICSKPITEDKKTWMLANGKWIPTNINANPNHRSYQMSSLYSPLGWLGWEALCNEWLNCQKDNEAKKAFVNTKLGETWYEKSEQPSHAKLKAREEPTNPYEINERVVRLFAGIDTQDDRFAVFVVGFGEDQEQWDICYEELMGSPALQSSWDNLKLFVDRPFKSRTGVDLFIESAGIDTGGHYTSEVYNFVRKNQDKYYALKGASTNIGTFLRQGKDIDFDLKTGTKYDNPLKLYLVNTTLAKKTIYGFLNNMLSNDATSGAGVIHFSNQLPDTFYTMLTSERLTRKQVNGVIQEKFVCPKNTRNEALDCYVYAYSIAYAVGRVNNLYGDEYKKVYEYVIGKKLKELELQEQLKNNIQVIEVKPHIRQRPTQQKDSWLENDGFSF